MMSTCPEKDIHSVYLDNELPPAYIADYEAHLATCEKCRAELEKLRRVRQILADDNKSLDLSASQMDSSFERLQARLSYSKVTKPQNKNVLTLGGAWAVLRNVGIGVAAALVVAVIIPVRQKSASQQSPAVSSSFKPVARTSMALPTSGHITVDGRVAANSLSTLFADEPELITVEAGQSIEPFNPGLYMHGSYLANPYTRAARTVNNTSASLASYDIFTPVPSPSEQNVVSGGEAKTSGFSFKFNSPLGVISLEIGSGN